MQVVKVIVLMLVMLFTVKLVMATTTMVLIALQQW